MDGSRLQIAALCHWLPLLLFPLLRHSTATPNILLSLPTTPGAIPLACIQTPMTRYNRHNAFSSCFVTSSSASKTAAVVLGVLMTLSRAGLTRAKMPGNPDPASSTTTTSPRLAFRDHIPAHSVSPTSPLLSLANHSPIDTITGTLTDAGSSTTSFSESFIRSESMI
jgi:hypothetical protein